MRALTVVFLMVAGLLVEGLHGPALAAEEPEGPHAAGAYRGAHRRDPFVRPGTAPGAEARTCAARGLEGVRVRELALRGIVRTPEGFLALLVGPNGVAFVTRVGDRLCDAKVGSIDPDAVTFERDAGPAGGVTEPRTVRVRLHAE
jgi:hypothetical protein